jgi:hypothetical protein
MKSMVVLVAAAAATLAVNISGAFSQEACSKAYVGCMNVCAERPTQSLQDMCMNSCQTNNNRCSADVYGSRQEVQQVSQPPGPRDGKKAMAKESSPPPRKVDVTPRDGEAHKSKAKAEGTLRKVDVPARRKADAKADAQAAKQQDKTEAAAEQAEPAEAKK